MRRSSCVPIAVMMVATAGCSPPPVRAALSPGSVEIPATLKEALDIIPVSHVDEVLSKALAEPIQPIEWTDADEHAAEPPVATHGGDAESVVRH